MTQSSDYRILPKLVGCSPAMALVKCLRAGCHNTSAGWDTAQESTHPSLAHHLPTLLKLTEGFSFDAYWAACWLLEVEIGDDSDYVPQANIRL